MDDRAGGDARRDGDRGAGRQAPSRLMRALGLAWSLTAFAVAFAVWPWMFAFLTNFPKRSAPWITPTVDTGPAMPLATAIAIDLGLIALLGLQHSGMARARFKGWLTRRLHLPEGLERTTYVWAANIALIALLLFWRPIPIVLWDLERPVRDAVWGLAGVGWLMGLVAFLQIDLLHLWGVRQALAWARGRTYEPPPIRQRGLYRLVRHPMYTALLILLWVTPTMTIGRLLFAAGFSLYLAIGIRLEERDLSAREGAAFEAFRKRTPALIPRLPFRASRHE